MRPCCGHSRATPPYSRQRVVGFRRQRHRMRSSGRHRVRCRRSPPLAAIVRKQMGCCQRGCARPKSSSRIPAPCRRQRTTGGNRYGSRSRSTGSGRNHIHRKHCLPLLRAASDVHALLAFRRNGSDCFSMGLLAVLSRQASRSTRTKGAGCSKPLVATLAVTHTQRGTK